MMKCKNNCGECSWAKRCRPNTQKPLTILNRLCSEYYKELRNGDHCVKYNPIFSQSKGLAVSVFKNENNLSCCDSEAIKTKEDIEEIFEIFKELFEFAVSLED